MVAIGCLKEANAQNNLADRKIAFADRLSGLIQIDGSLDDGAWINISVSQDFQELSPQPGTPPQFQTEVRFAYDDAALYIGARMWDAAPDSIFINSASGIEWPTPTNSEFGSAHLTTA